MGDTISTDMEGMLPTGADGALAKRLRAHPQPACSELYDRFSADLFWFLLAQLRGERETAEDLLVETFADAVRDIGRYDATRATFSSWLHGIARRRVHMELHHRARRKAVPHALQVPLDAAVESGASADLAAGAAARLDAQRTVFALAQVLSDLEMAILTLSYVEEFSLREIAHIVGRSEKAVESILHRAKRKARERLGVQNDE
jgi:RNA polymerase sigma-70 factor, ECF subfamily